MPYHGVALAVILGVGIAAAAFLYFLNEDWRRQPLHHTHHDTDQEPINSWTRPTSDSTNTTNNNNNNNKRRRSRRNSFANCAICFENVQLTCCKTLSCDHTFHVDCITKWLHEKRECPVCRRPQY